MEDCDIVRSYVKTYGFAGKAAAALCECCELLDEYEYEAEDPIAEEVGEMVVKAIVWAGKFLKLNVPLAGEAKIGRNWKETH